MQNRHITAKTETCKPGQQPQVQTDQNYPPAVKPGIQTDKGSTSDRGGLEIEGRKKGKKR